MKSIVMGFCLLLLISAKADSAPDTNLDAGCTFTDAATLSELVMTNVFIIDLQKQKIIELEKLIEVLLGSKCVCL